MSDPSVLGVGTKALTQPLASKTAPGGPQEGKSFMNTLKDSIQKVEDQQQAADHSMQDLAVGRTKNLHEAMISMEQADISFKMLMAVRTKLINAYQEVMRMSF